MSLGWARPPSFVSMGHEGLVLSSFFSVFASSSSGERLCSFREKDLLSLDERRALRARPMRMSPAATSLRIAWEIQHVVASEPPARKTHALTDLVEDSLLLQVRCDQSHFTQPRWGCSLRFRRGLDMYRSIGDTTHVCLLERM